MEYNILNDFSVVIQGKVFGSPDDPYEKQLTLQCIESIRKYLPNAEIIISTWEGTDVSHLKYDKVVFNNDPGAIAFTDLQPTYLNNNNRQIVSTYNGLKAATKKYAIKMRGDCQLISTGFLNYLKEYPRSPKYRFLNQRVIIPTRYSRNPRRIAMLLHPSDIFQVGLLEDLLNMWNVPQQTEPGMTRGIPANKRIINHSLIGNFYRMKMGSEQYLWYAFAKQKGLDLELNYFSELPVSKILDSEFSVINNFVIAEAKEIGVLLPEKIANDPNVKDLYTYEEWLHLSNIYAKPKLSEAYNWGLITQVYASNVKVVLKRVVEKLRWELKKRIFNQDK